MIESVIRDGYYTKCFNKDSQQITGLWNGIIHLRRRQIFTIFDPYPPPVGSFLLLSIRKFGQFLTPKKCQRLLKMDGTYGISEQYQIDPR